MNLAEEMRNMADSTLDTQLFEVFKEKALSQIRNVASHGDRHTEIFFDYHDEPLFRSIEFKEVYWRELKKFLDNEGFKTSIGEYQGFAKYGWQLDVNW